MIYALQRLWDKRKAELESYDIKIVAAQNLIITDNQVIRLDSATTEIQLQRILQPMIRRSKEKLEESRKRKQLTLFQEEK